LGDCLVISTM